MLGVLFTILFYGTIAALIVYLIFKRIEDKKKEDFEKRDN